MEFAKTENTPIFASDLRTTGNSERWQSGRMRRS